MDGDAEGAGRDEAGVGGDVDGGIDDACLHIFFVKEEGGCSGGICGAERREMVQEKVNEEKEVESHGGESGYRDKSSQEEWP